MKKKIKNIIINFFIITLIASGLLIGNSSSSADVRSDFISQLAPDIIQVSQQYNLYGSVMMAQAALESNFGQSELSQQANNYFGIKGNYNGQSISIPTSEYDSNGNVYQTNVNFKKYPNIQSSLRDNALLLRNGLMGNPNYYAGAWRENTSSFMDATNTLSGRYATNPNYSVLLNNIINQYNLTSLLDSNNSNNNNYPNNNNTDDSFNNSSSINDSSSINSNSSSSSSANSSSSSSINNNQNERNNQNQTDNSGINSKSAKKSIRYYSGSGNETANLSSQFANYELLNHVKGSNYPMINYPWPNVDQNQKVYVDSKADNHSSWYRIRFSKSHHSKKYWVNSNALQFNSAVYRSFKWSVNTNKLDHDKVYTHVYDTYRLSQHVNESNELNNLSYKFNMMAILPKNNINEVWYRIIDNNNRNVWIKSNSNQNIQYLPSDQIKTINGNYNSYPLYSHVVGSYNNNPTHSWSNVEASHINNVHVDLSAINMSDKSVWCRIKIGNQKYWISSNALR